MTPQDQEMVIHVFTSLMIRPISGRDTMIAVCPPELYAADRQTPSIDPGLVKLLTKMSHAGAANLGEELHHADWVITSDPATVQQRGLAHDCARCRAGLDQAMAYLKEHPTANLLVGLLFWAGPA